MAMWAWSAVSSSFSLPNASLRYWISFVSLALISAIGVVASFWGLLFGPTRWRGAATSAGAATVSAMSSVDDDDRTGTPPEGHYSASRANPGFWAENRAPLS